MTDYSVMRTYESLIDLYASERARRSPRTTEQTDVESGLFEDARRICEWRLGRGQLDGEGTIEPPTAIDIDTLLLCLKRLLNSVKKWNQRGGRQGYLQFMSQYVR